MPNRKNDACLSPAPLCQRAGFTLLEILMVMTVIAVLAAILLPVFQNIRARGPQATCAANLRQIFVSCALYAGDNDTYLPPYTSEARDVTMNGTDASRVCTDGRVELAEALQPYTHSRAIWFCPYDDTASESMVSSGCHKTVPNVFGYRYRGFEFSSHGIEPLRIDRSGRSRLRVSEDPSKGSLTEEHASPPWEVNGEICRNSYSQPNHNGRWNRVFMDGHVGTYAFHWTSCTNADREIR